jgi:signal transduction histidine kinase
VELVVQVSNHNFREGGVVGEVLFGSERALLMHLAQTEFVPDLMFIAIFAVMGLYHLVIYLVRRNEQAYLWIGIIGVATALRILTLNEVMVHAVLPGIRWATIIRTEYIVEMLIVIAYAQYIQKMYPLDVSRWMRLFTWVMSLGLIGYFVVTNTAQFTSTLMWHWVLIMLVMIYYLIVVGVRVIWMRREGSKLNALGLVVFMVGVINEGFYYVLGWTSFSISIYCMLFYFLFQAIIVSYRYSRLAEQNQRLSGELLAVNRQLERKVAERTAELHQKNVTLTELHEQRSAMMANLAHDLGSPMAGIQMHLQLMEDELQDGVPRKNVLRQLNAKIQYIKQLVDDLFELSRLESGHTILQLDWIDLQTLVGDLRELIKQKSGLEPIEVDLQLEAAINAAPHQQVAVDRNGLDRILRNYLDNAVKFSRTLPCQIEVRVTLVDRKQEVDGRASYVQVSVRDQGIGIEESELPHLFRRFYQTESRLQGSGLGLAIVKELVEQHGGTVGVDSVLGEGSTFWFTLPVGDGSR